GVRIHAGRLPIGRRLTTCPTCDLQNFGGTTLEWRCMPRSAAAVEKFFQLSLLGLVASGFLAVAGSGHLDAPTTVLATAGLLLRGALAAGLLRLEFSERLVTILTIAYIGFYPLDFQFLSRD